MDQLQADLARLKKERSQLRRIFTIAAKAVEDCFNNESLSSDLRQKYALFSDKASRLFKIDEKVGDILLTTTLCGDDDELAREYDSTESYRDTYIRIGAKFEQLGKCEDDDTVVSGATNRKSKTMLKLPKIVPVEFDGQLKNWIHFWSIFKRIHESDEYDDGEKFQYLLLYMAKGSPARELVESFPPLANNYAKAVQSLRARFGREDLLIEWYVRELLSLVLLRAKGDETPPLQKLYDQLVTQIHALESLGVASDKYTYLLTPLVESALPDEVLRDWQRDCKMRSLLEEVGRDGFDKLAVKMEQMAIIDVQSVSKDDKMQRLLAFLQREVESEEGLTLKRTAFSDVTPEPSKTPSRESQKEKGFPRPKNHSKPKPQTAAGLVNIKSEKVFECVFCSSIKHTSADCVKAREKSRDELQLILKSKGLCFRCVRGGHGRQTCKVFVKCIICNGSHVPLMCPDRKMPDSSAEKPSFEDSKMEQTLHNVCHNSVLMQTLRVRIKGVPHLTARVLYDSGSQRSYVTKQLVEKMNGTPTGEIKVEHALFGGVVSKPKSHKSYRIRLEDMSREYSCNFEVLDADTICVAVPSVPIKDLVTELEQQKIQLTDLEDGPIDILIGSDIAGRLITGRKVELESGLVAFHTLLGWTLMGKIPNAETQFLSHINLFTSELSIQDLWRLETIGIEDSVQVKSREQRAETAKEHFLENVEILDSGRYQVKLPWSDDHPPLPRNFDLALKRLESTVRKLKATSNESQYFEIFQEWLNTGVIEEVPYSNWDSGHYLPHRPVLKEGSTTPIRPVFNASAKVKGFPSLNQCLEIGPNLVELIPSVLLRFRMGKVGLIADVKRAFLQISLHPGDRDFLRFLWKGEDGRLRIFRHARVVFGVCSSPFLLGAVLDNHLTRCKELILPSVEDTGRDTKLAMSDVIDTLQRCMYVDNFVGSLDNPGQIQDFIERASSLFSLACFELRGWAYSNENLGDHTETPVLGLLWDGKGDTLKINVPKLSDVNPYSVTKKDLMSVNHRLFDPIGFTSPITVTPKKLIQEAWRAGGGWDTPIDEKNRDQFIQWASEIEVLRDIELPRWICGTNAETAAVSLHTFCDASQIAYASVVFLRTEWRGYVNVQLVAAKTRIAPVQKVTIPRLELLAATVGARLASNILKILTWVQSCYYWSDSSTTLTWIKRDQPWAVFVRNRVDEIRRLSKPDCWRHVPGNLNPADLASRGCSPRSLVLSKWWEGPTWLKLPENEWPKSSVEFDEPEAMKERLKGALVSHCEVPFSAQCFTSRFSRYWKILKVVGWIVRFFNNSQKGATKTEGRLSLKELQMAEKWLVRLAQKEAFTEEGMVDLRRLKPQKSGDGLLRVRTKIWARKDSEDFRAPLILPSNHKIVDKLIFHVHCQNGHIVGQHLLNILRERFWLIKGRRTVRRIVGSCKVCKRFVAENLKVESPPLPEERVRDASVFEVTGTDFAGPLYLVDGTKVWVCLFTCAIYRAIHLELVTSLSTECFMLAFRRFVARRGRPSVLYSDNGTNFRGTKNLLDSIDWDKVVDFGDVHKIEWRFNPPSAPWWGGFWERMVRTLKMLLRKNIGRASLTYEELNTVICDCEALINSRPITYVSETPEEPVPITPQMFLQEIRESGVPDCDHVDAKTLNRRIKHRQVVQEELRRRFRAEYLGQLTLNSKFGDTREPKIGEIVLIGSDSQKRLNWPLGIVEEIFRGRDGHVRVIRLRTAEGNLLRPIQRIFPLELSSEPEIKAPPAEENPEELFGTHQDVTPLPYDLKKHVTTEVARLAPNGPVQQSIPKTPENPLYEEKPAVKICETVTRCGRKVKLPIKFQ